MEGPYCTPDTNRSTIAPKSNRLRSDFTENTPSKAHGTDGLIFTASSWTRNPCHRHSRLLHPTSHILPGSHRGGAWLAHRAKLSKGIGGDPKLPHLDIVAVGDHLHLEGMMMRRSIALAQRRSYPPCSSPRSRWMRLDGSAAPTNSLAGDQHRVQ